MKSCACSTSSHKPTVCTPPSAPTPSRAMMRKNWMRPWRSMDRGKHIAREGRTFPTVIGAAESSGETRTPDDRSSAPCRSRHAWWGQQTVSLLRNSHHFPPGFSSPLPIQGRDCSHHQSHRRLLNAKVCGSVSILSLLDLCRIWPNNPLSPQNRRPRVPLPLLQMPSSLSCTHSSSSPCTWSVAPQRGTALCPLLGLCTQTRPG